VRKGSLSTAMIFAASAAVLQLLRTIRLDVAQIQQRCLQVSCLHFQRRRNLLMHIGEQNNLFIREFPQICLSMRHKQVFGLCAVDGVSESPAADRSSAL
jgi:hypothetical protein